MRDRVTFFGALTSTWGGTCGGRACGCDDWDQGNCSVDMCRILACLLGHSRGVFLVGGASMGGVRMLLWLPRSARVQHVGHSSSLLTAGTFFHRVRSTPPNVLQEATEDTASGRIHF